MNDTDPDNTIDGVMPAEEMARLLSARESKGAWDAGAENVYAGHDTCPKHSGPESLRRRHGSGCTCRVVAQVDDDCDRALVAAAPHLAESGLALHAEVARLRAEREAFHNGLRTALAKGVGEPDSDIARAARSDAELNEAYERWVAVGMHGLVGLSLYRRNNAGEVEFVRHGTQEEDDAHIITFQTALRAMTRWRDAATSFATTFASWWMTMTALGAPGLPEDRRDQLTAEAREITRKMLKLCGGNGAEVGQ